MKRVLVLTACLGLLSVAQFSPAVAAGLDQHRHTRALQAILTDGTDCSATGVCTDGTGGGSSCQDKLDTTHGTECTVIAGSEARCACTAGPLPVNAKCWSTHDSAGAPCDTAAGLSCNTYQTTGYCLPANIKNYEEDCGAAGLSCRRGSSCVYVDASLPTNYTACIQPAPAGACLCQPGPIPVGGYCFIYGAACAEGSICYTGRADATAGYCRSTADPVVQAPASGPEMAPSGAPEIAPGGSSMANPVGQTGQACSPTGATCGNGQTCVNIQNGTVCGATSTTGCECSTDELEEGSRCDLYGAPCTDSLTCTTPRPDTTVGKCTASSGSAGDTGGDLLPAGSDCSATGTHCEPGTTCEKNAGSGAFCDQTATGFGTCTCTAGSTLIGVTCDPWGAPCDGTSRCTSNPNGVFSCSTAVTATVAQPSCAPNGPYCGVGKSCIVSSGSATGSMCSTSSQTCTCSATAMPANQVCELYGAPCGGGTVCRPARADSVQGFCLPQYWPASINTAGAGSSSGGVSGAWTGGFQGPNGAGVYPPGYVFPSPPSPPPPPPTATLRPVSKTATKVYSVKATCTLADVLITDFQQAAYRNKFLATMTSSIEALTGSPVNCTITSYKSGSVIAVTQTDFLDANPGSASTYATAMKNGNTATVFGTGYGSVTVDPSSVVTSQVTNPSKTSGAMTVNLSLAAVTLVSLAVASIFVWRLLLT